MRGGADETLSETHRAKISPEKPYITREYTVL